MFIPNPKCATNKGDKCIYLNEISEVMVKPLCNDGLLVGGPTLSAVQLYTATAGEQNPAGTSPQTSFPPADPLQKTTEHWTSGGRSITNLRSDHASLI